MLCNLKELIEIKWFNERPGSGKHDGQYELGVVHLKDEVNKSFRTLVSVSGCEVLRVNDVMV